MDLEAKKTVRQSSQMFQDVADGIIHIPFCADQTDSSYVKHNILLLEVLVERTSKLRYNNG